MELLLFQFFSLESSLDGLEMRELSASELLLGIEWNDMCLSLLDLFLLLLGFLGLLGRLLLGDDL